MFRSVVFLSMLIIGIQIIFSKDVIKKENVFIKPIARAGYNYYQMNDFNSKLDREDNKNINGGASVSIELYSPYIQTFFSNIFSNENLNPIGIQANDFQLFMIGLEYLHAESKTNHTSGTGVATVDWELPIWGVYWIPYWEPLLYSGKVDVKMHIQPFGVGYYQLANNAKLTVSDRPGQLEVSDETFGILGRVGTNLYIGGEEEGEPIFLISLSIGYRALKFTDISQKESGGFTVTPGGGLVQPSNLPETLDYSGFFIQVGAGLAY